ncbi:hypothetical protein [Andreprevotia lacus]|jgi:hypothetical protein|nr:hypothetical protein [Andreprevotia lacus]
MSTGTEQETTPATPEITPVPPWQRLACGVLAAGAVVLIPAVIYMAVDLFSHPGMYSPFWQRLVQVIGLGYSGVYGAYRFGYVAKHGYPPKRWR